MRTWSVGMSSLHRDPLPIQIDPHYSPQFFAELWGISASTVGRWFQDVEGVLKLSESSMNGRRTRWKKRSQAESEKREKPSE